MGQGEDIDPFRPSPNQDLGTFIHGRTGGVNIIDQQNRLPLHPFSIRDMDGSLDSLFPLSAVELDLRRSGFPLLQHPSLIRDFGPAAQLFCQEEGLIEPPLS